MIFQEKIIQSDTMAYLHEKSLNTLRIMTLIINDRVYALKPIIRVVTGDNSVGTEGVNELFIGVKDDGTLNDYGFDIFGDKITEEIDGKLDELILDQFPLDDKFGARARDHYIGNIEAALDSIYNIEYNHDDNKKPPKPKEQEMKKSLIISGLATMFDNTYRLANFQIGVDTQDFSREMASSVNYRFRKIEKIMDDMMQYYSGKYNFSKEEVQAVYDSFNEPRMGLGNRAVALDLLTKQGHKIKNPGEFERQVSFAKRGITFSKENMEILNEGYGIDFQGSIGYTGAMSITTDLGYDDIVLKEDYDQGLVWDNESAGIIMRNIYRENMIKKGFRTREQYILQEMPTEEMPIVEPGKPGQTIDPDKTEEIPVVDPDKT